MTFKIKNGRFVFGIGLVVLAASVLSVDAIGGKATGFVMAEGHEGGPPVFEDVDANGNDLIEREEGAEYFIDEYPNIEEYNAEFDRVDVNGDGVVDRGEFDAEIKGQIERAEERAEDGMDLGEGPLAPPGGGDAGHPSAELIEERNAELQTVVDGISELLSGLTVDETNAPALLPLLHSFGPHKGPKGGPGPRGPKGPKGGPRIELPEDVMDALAEIAQALERVHALEAELASHAGPKGWDGSSSK